MTDAQLRIWRDELYQAKLNEVFSTSAEQVNLRAAQALDAELNGGVIDTLGSAHLTYDDDL